MSAALTTDRRRADRFLPAFVTYCRAGGDEGLVWNLSATGLGMLIAYPPEVGAALPVEVSNYARTLPLVAQVAHTRQLDAGDYFVGLRFTRPLAADELGAFVQKA